MVPELVGRRLKSDESSLVRTGQAVYEEWCTCCSDFSGYGCTFVQRYFARSSPEFGRTPQCFVCCGAPCSVRLNLQLAAVRAALNLLYTRSANTRRLHDAEERHWRSASPSGAHLTHRVMG